MMDVEKIKYKHLVCSAVKIVCDYKVIGKYQDEN